jgi:hypothetical protein
MFKPQKLLETIERKRDQRIQPRRGGGGDSKEECINAGDILRWRNYNCANDDQKRDIGIWSPQPGHALETIRKIQSTRHKK